MTRLIGSIYAGQFPPQMGLQDSVADMGEKARRQHTVIEAAGLKSGHRPEVWTRPQEIIGFGNDNPRGQIVKTEMGLEGSGYFDRICRISRRRMRYRHDGYYLVPLDHLPRGDDRAGPVFAAFFVALIPSP